MHGNWNIKFAQNIFYQSYQLPEGLACKAPTLYFCAAISEPKKTLILHSGLYNTMVEPSARYCEILRGFRVESTQEDSIFYTYRP